MQVGPSRKEPPVLVSTTVSCEHAEVLVSRRLDGELDPSDALLLDAHLKCCENCRAHLQFWTSQSDTLSQSLNGLWSVPSDALSATVKTAPPEKQVRPFWVPLGMMASQFAAFIGLGLYIMFCASPASAPGNDRLSGSSSRPALESKTETEIVPAPLSVEGDKHASQIPVIQSAPVSQIVEKPAAPAPIAAAPVAASSGPLNVSHSDPAPTRPVAQEQGLASINIPNMPMLIPNVAMDFEISIPGSEEKDSGRVAILGDFFHGKAIVRLTDANGTVSEFAQPDLDTVLSAPRRLVVKRFLAECSRPEMRSRFEEVLRRQALDARYNSK